MKPLEGYTEDQSLSGDVRSRMHGALLLKGESWRFLFFLLPIPAVLGLWSIYPLIVAIGISLIPFVGLWIILSNKAGDHACFDCPRCAKPLNREWIGGIEYFVCRQCRIFAKGRDYSD